MPVLCDDSGTLYRQITYELEADFERVVVELADRMFGPSTLYVDVKRRIKGNNVLSIPDGYVLDMTEPDDPKLFIVENEIAKHDPFKHIGIQLLKFATSFDEAKTDVRNFVMDAIAKNAGSSSASRKPAAAPPRETWTTTSTARSTARSGHWS